VGHLDAPAGTAVTLVVDGSDHRRVAGPPVEAARGLDGEVGRNGPRLESRKVGHEVPELRRTSVM
jgi:hypothetical protein